MVDNDFVEKGLTLEEAYILGRVRSLSDENSIYRETNEEIAKVMGKSVSSVKRCINNLVKKGYLRKGYNWRSRMLYLADKEKLFEDCKKEQEESRKSTKEFIKNGCKEEPKKTPLDNMTLDEKVTYLKTMIDKRKFMDESDRDFL